MPGHVQKFYKVLVCLAIVSSLLIGVYVSLIPSFVYTYTPQEVVEVPVTSVADTRLKSPPALHEHSQLVNGSSIPETNSVENSKRSLERAPLYMNMSNMSNKHTRLLMSEPQAERNGDEKRQVSKMSKMEYPPRQASSATVHPDIHSPQTVISQLDSSDGCSVLPCLNVLSSSEKNTYNECHKKALVLLKDVEECKCRFVNGTGRKRVALVSLPGSGNTWVRGLLEKTTGICTGIDI